MKGPEDEENREGENRNMAPYVRIGVALEQSMGYGDEGFGERLVQQEIGFSRLLSAQTPTSSNA